MAGQKFLPHGASVTFSSADVGGISDISTPTRTRGVAETTDNDSGGDREFVPGLRDGGDFSITVRWIPDDAGQAALISNAEASFASAVPEECVITLPDQATTDSTVTTITFDAFVTSIDGSLPQTDDSPAERTFNLKVTSAVTEATA